MSRFYKIQKHNHHIVKLQEKILRKFHRHEVGHEIKHHHVFIFWRVQTKTVAANILVKNNPQKSLQIRWSAGVRGLLASNENPALDVEKMTEFIHLRVSRKFKPSILIWSNIFRSSNQYTDLHFIFVCKWTRLKNKIRTSQNSMSINEKGFFFRLRNFL